MDLSNLDIFKKMIFLNFKEDNVNTFTLEVIHHKTWTRQNLGKMYICQS